MEAADGMSECFEENPLRRVFFYLWIANSADEGKADAINQRAMKILQAGYHARIIYKVNVVPGSGQTAP